MSSNYPSRTLSAHPTVFATRLQRLFIPSIMPTGLDVYQIINQRDRFIEARVQQRIRELEQSPATIGEGGFESLTDDILGAPKQETADENQQLSAPQPHTGSCALSLSPSLSRCSRNSVPCGRLLQRGSFKGLCFRSTASCTQPTLRDTRVTEQAERKQRIDRERRAKHKHVEQLSVICQHGRDIFAVNRAAQEQIAKLGRAVLSFHAFTEKEEQKPVERISKECSKALKADEEEAYMKLIDTAKDTRITHLLRQTDAYLDALAQAVVAQQNESGSLD